MEAYQIGTQQALQQLLTPGQNAKDLIRRKRDVQKVADGDVGPFPLNHLGHQHQLIIVHPNIIALAQHLQGFIGKFPVHGHVGLPKLGMKIYVLGKVMK